MKGKTISYRPSEKVEKLFSKYSSEKSILSNTQLIEIAFQYLINRPEDEIDEIIWSYLIGKDNSTTKQKKIG